MNAIRSLPLNDVVYAIPVLVWLASFGLSCYLPKSVFRQLCLRFCLAPSPPTVAQADMDLPENVEAMAAAMSAAASSSSHHLGHVDQDVWLSAAGAQRRRYLIALLKYPIRLAAYWKDVLTMGDGDEGGAAAASHWLGYSSRVLAAAVRCFTALCVHANRPSLISSVFTYLNALSVGKQCDFRYEAVGDMAGAVVAAMLSNALMLLSIKALNGDGFQAPSRAAIVANRPVLHWIRYVLFPWLRIALLLVNVNALSFRFARVRGRAGGQDQPMAAPGATAEEGFAHREEGVEAAVPADESAAPVDDYAPTTWARAAGAVEITAPRALFDKATRTRLPPMAYLCGGESLSYAFSGFRFAFRGDIAQLRGAAWCYWMDSVQSYMSLWLRRGATAEADMTASSSSSASSAFSATLPLANNPFTTVDSATGDVYFTSASSDELTQQNIVAFLSGCAVGVVALQGPLALRLARRTPLLSQLVNLIFPAPLPAIDIPDGLMEATLTDLGVVRLYYHPHHSRHGDRPLTQSQGEGRVEAADTADGGEDGETYSANGSIVVDTQPPLQMLRPITDPSPAGERQTVGPGAASAAAPEPSAEIDAPAYLDIPVPPQCFCPITRCLMRDPVKTVDGFTYDRDAITAWLRRRATSPMTNLALQDATLVSNREVYALIEGIVQAYHRFAAEHHHQQHQQH